MSRHELIIEGARQNNLRNINLSLPHNKVIAVTGVSGSGKSSLAFDTIFAEGQWRFVESISTYARLFLEKLDRPDVDAIKNIRPAVALEQKNPVRGARSTVGTLTEIYDLLRLLYSRVSMPYCPKCGREIRKWDTSQVTQRLLEEYHNRKALIVFGTSEPTEELKKRGFQRAWLDGEVIDLGSGTPPEADRPAGLRRPDSELEIVLDRLVIKDEPRLTDSIEMAWREGNESLKVIIPDDRATIGETTTGFAELNFSSENSCDECRIVLPEASPLLFSFNHPVGACPECKGFGNVLRYDEGLIIPDEMLSLSEGAIEPWEKPSYKWWKRQMADGARKTGIDLRKPFRELSAQDRQKIFEGVPAFYGINDFFKELEGKRYKLHVRVFLSRYRNASICPACNGRRLLRDALSYKVSGRDIAEVCDLPVSGLIEFFNEIDLSPFQKGLAKEILRQIDAKLLFLRRVGLDYLTLSRQGRTLSGGEYQRVNLSNQLASRLTGTLYVLDEPTVGLHPRDTERVADIMAELAGIGNTIIVVEHDKGIIESADWVVELGPGGGQQGGEVVFSGAMEDFRKANTLTAGYLSKTLLLESPDRMMQTNKSRRIGPADELHKDVLLLSGAKGNNLKDVNLKIPFYSLTSVTGVSGSGKSSLVVETLYKALSRHLGIEHETPLQYSSIENENLIKGLKIIDQSPVGRSPRSNPVTYLKIFDHIRKLFSEQVEARAHGYGPGFFSFNLSGGRCETCKGEGYQKLEMYFFEDIYARCEDCGGTRYSPEALRVTYKGRNIDDVLKMTVDEASGLFYDSGVILSRLSLMKEVGLGYMKLGQPATTLSGGEAQRLKICSELSSGTSRDVLYILDEPTVGLHFRDVGRLISVLRRLVGAGNTVVVIEHNLEVIAASDWIIDLGPEGGERGGRIIFEGRPAAIINAKESYTGRYLRKALNGPG